MPDLKLSATEFLQKRRSVPAKTLGLPVPDKAALMPLLTAACRVPDHGKLEPWRFVVLERGAMERLASLARTRAEALGLDDEKSAKGVSQFEMGQLAVVVISSPKASDKIPQIEQLHSASCVCLSLLNAALAAGWGANWLTGWPTYDQTFIQEGFGAVSGESVVGIIHIGSITTPSPERPRPDVASLVTWSSE
ncbi:nitroreductase family protein [Pseudorhodobacter aquimaris]|uniref:nitroreductase family protein n=1 Tax=Pseudorhodobacter aquimaris TaxID=687412 RepID=UPI00067B0CAB|nr:nitroreductase [Pseudorhodobacter aquimaris]